MGRRCLRVRTRLRQRRVRQAHANERLSLAATPQALGCTCAARHRRCCNMREHVATARPPKLAAECVMAARRFPASSRECKLDTLRHTRSNARRSTRLAHPRSSRPESSMRLIRRRSPSACPTRAPSASHGSAVGAALIRPSSSPSSVSPTPTRARTVCTPARTCYDVFRQALWCAQFPQLRPLVPNRACVRACGRAGASRVGVGFGRGVPRRHLHHLLDHCVGAVQAAHELCCPSAEAEANGRNWLCGHCGCCRRVAEAAHRLQRRIAHHPHRAGERGHPIRHDVALGDAGGLRRSAGRARMRGARAPFELDGHEAVGVGRCGAREVGGTASHEDELRDVSVREPVADEGGAKELHQPAATSLL